METGSEGSEQPEKAKSGRGESLSSVPIPPHKHRENQTPLVAHLDGL